MYTTPIALTKKQCETIEAEIAKGADFWFGVKLSHTSLFSRVIFIGSGRAQEKTFRQVRSSRLEKNIDERAMHVAEALAQELKEKYPEAKFMGVLKSEKGSQ